MSTCSEQDEFWVKCSTAAQPDVHAKGLCKQQSLAMMVPLPKSVHVCTVLDEELHDVRMAISTCPPQRLTPTLVNIVQVRAVLEEHLLNVRMALLSCHLQRRVVVIATCVYICAVLEEELHNSCMATPRCHPQSPNQR